MDAASTPAARIASLVGDSETAALLISLMDLIVPADEFASARQLGGEEFLAGVLAAEGADWLPRFLSVADLIKTATVGGPPFAERSSADQLAILDDCESDKDFRWFADLVSYGYYADSGNGGNAATASWQMLGWSPAPAGGWPAGETFELDRSVFVGPQQLGDHYDAIVVGSGAGGGVAACVLTEGGRRVLLIERGDYLGSDFLAQDHLRNARVDVGFDDRTAPGSDPRTVLIDDHPVAITARDGRWSNNAMTLGGGTRIFGAQAWRFSPEDFQMATTYGIPEGSALADWPISYDDLEPYYTKVDWELGVSGSPIGDTAIKNRSRDYPMPPLSDNSPAAVLAAGAAKVGINTTAVPLLINSESYNGRQGCARCGQCVGFACPVEAKNGSHNTVLARAAATGLLTVLTASCAERITTDSRGRVTGVAIVGESAGQIWRATIAADEVVVSAGAVESARLLLNSTSDSEPNGLGNNHDQVGRHLQGHVYAGALGIFDEAINDGRGPGPSVATNDFRHHNPGLVGGGMIANEFVPTPISTRGYLIAAGLLPHYGSVAKERLRWLLPRMQRIVGPVQEVTRSDSRVQLDPTVRDRFGIPVARLSGSHHPEDLRVQAFLANKAAEWLTASGAQTVVRAPLRADGYGPSAGQHQAGTARMGTNSKTSVTDPFGRVWGHDNLRVVDGSLNVTNGGVNPVLTILANSFRVMEAMVGR